jgi:hypothetical protein
LGVIHGCVDPCLLDCFRDALDWITPPPPLFPTPVLGVTRSEATWLVLLPLNKLLPSTPFNRKLLLVSRSPLAQMGALPRPELTPVPPGSSALTPGERMARPVKLPVGSGIASICALSMT